MAVVAPGGAFSGLARAEEPAAASPSVEATADAGTEAGSEADQLAQLREMEARLSLGESLGPSELERLEGRARSSRHVSVRALAVSVLAWLEPARAVDPLLSSLQDENPRVRAASAQSLLALARRMSEDQRRRVLPNALALLDDSSDEVACAGAELVGGTSPESVTDALRRRTADVNDLRASCFARVAGLPPRPIAMPPLPHRASVVGEAPAAAPAAPAIVPPTGTWLFVGAAASTGLLAGGLLASGLLPARDVLTYRSASTRIVREEVAFPTQALSAIGGAALLGGGAWALSTYVRPLRVEQARAVVLGTGALGLAGASAQLAFGLRPGPADWASAAGVSLGLGGSAALAYAAPLDVNDEILSGAGLALGGLTGALAAFAATPVGISTVGDALRVDFGLGVAGMTAGASSFGALVAGAFVDVPRARTAAVLTGAMLGGGGATALGFLLVPASDVKSRVACGVGLAGELLGIVGGLLVPNDWLPAEPLAVGAAVHVDGARWAFGVPRLQSWPAASGANVVGATLLEGNL